MELNIKTFIKDSRRPAWLLRLLSAVKYWCPFTNIKREDASSVISLIESEIRNTTWYVARKGTVLLTMSGVK